MDLKDGRLLEVVADRTRAAVHSWLEARSRDWLAQVATVALDPWRGYVSALFVPLGHATVVVDHFHAVRLANAVVELSRLARTVRAWQAEILAWHVTDGCSNGPTEAVNLLIKIKPIGHGFVPSPTTGCYCTAASVAD